MTVIFIIFHSQFFIPTEVAMPAPRWVARVNRRVTNKILGPMARYMPGFGVIGHTGRKSQRLYHTPVCVFRRSGGYVVALTYGPDTDWVRNVKASGSCTLETRGRTYQLSQPRLFHDETHHVVPPLVRLVLGSTNVNDFLELSEGDRR